MTARRVTGSGLLAEMEALKRRLTASGLVAEAEAIARRTTAAGLTAEGEATARRVTASGIMVEIRPARSEHNMCVELFVYDKTTGDHLATLHQTWARKFSVAIGDVGAGSFTISRADAKAIESLGYLNHGNRIEVRYRNQAIFHWHIEAKRAAQVEHGGDVRKVFVVSGRGVMTDLEYAVVHPDSVASPTSKKRSYTAATFASIIRDQLTEATTRGVSVPATDFTDTLDSTSVAFTDSQTLDINVGETLLQVLRRGQALGVDFAINPANRELQCFVAMGTDKSDTIRFAESRDIGSASRHSNSTGIRTAVLVGGAGLQYEERTDAAGITTWGRREAYLPARNIGTSGQMQAVGDILLTRAGDLNLQAHRIQVVDETQNLYSDYWIGDTVTLALADRPNADLRIMSLAVSDDGNCNPVIELELSHVDEQFLLRQQRWLDDMLAGRPLAAAAGLASGGDVVTQTDMSGAVVTDHGALTGLGDDDHTQYILADGTRSGATSQAQEFGSNGVTAAKVQATDSNGLQLLEDGGSGILIEDSTGAVGVGTTSPLSEMHLATANDITLRVTSGNYDKTSELMFLEGQDRSSPSGGFVRYKGASNRLEIGTIDTSFSYYPTLYLSRGVTRLGVGKSVPSTTLDVGGTIRGVAFNANGSAGASGTFTTADSKTVTVTSGIITAIV